MVHLGLSALFGWLFLPRSLLHLLGGYADTEMPAWASAFVVGYNLVLLTLQALFLKYRRVWLLIPVLVIASVSVVGCESYMATLEWDR